MPRSPEKQKRDKWAHLPARTTYNRASSTAARILVLDCIRREDEVDLEADDHVMATIPPNTVHRYNYPVVIPEWDDTNTVVYPSSSFGVLPDTATEASIVQRYRERFSADSITLGSCVICFRASPMYLNTIVSEDEFI